MKRYGNLFSQIIDPENLYRAHINARKGKTQYRDVQRVDKDPARYLGLLQARLAAGDYRTAPYKTKEIFEPKQRTIYILPYFPDRIVHHAVMQVLQPIWDTTFMFDLYSAIPGKGLHAGSRRLRTFLRDRPGTQYCLKYDISKFYPSMQHDILQEILRTKIKCRPTLALLDEIITSPGGTTNVPIGNYLSQYFSNLYLTPFDHWLKEEQGARYYIRYCDDGVILGPDKARLRDLLSAMQEELGRIGLTLNRKTQLFPVERGIDFLGYRHFRNYTLLRKSTATRFKRAIRRLERHGDTMQPETVISCVMAYVGWMQHCDAHHLFRTYIGENTALQAVVARAAHNADINNPLEKYLRHESPVYSPARPARA